MTEIKLAVRKQSGQYEPGEEIAGGVQWQVKKAHAAEVRLLWYTEGRGFQNVQVVDKVHFDDAQADDTRSFQFTAPQAPYSFTGSLMVINWVVEVVTLPGNENARIPLVIAPGGKPCSFYGVQTD